MSSSGHKIISIAQTSAAKELSRTQKQFNNLIKKIEAQKQTLLEWQEALPLYNQKISGEYQALWDTYNQHRVDTWFIFWIEHMTTRGSPKATEPKSNTS